MTKSAQHIVSIDDEANILKLIEAVLKDYQLTTFLKSEDAVEAFQQGLKPDLILCDVTMPELDGFGVHQVVRSISALRSVPFIYLTGLDDRENFRKGMLHGADDYVTKPFTPKELKEAVETRLERSQIVQQSDRQLRISSLGGVNMAIDGTIVHYEAKKVVELLLYLLSSKKKYTLGSLRKALWWKDVTDNSIHVLINRTRKSLGEVLTLKLEKGELVFSLEQAYEWDAELFEKKARAALSEKSYTLIDQAIRDYKGSFLPGFDSPWANEQRSYYESLYLNLLQEGIKVAPNEATRKKAEVRLADYLA